MVNALLISITRINISLYMFRKKGKFTLSGMRRPLQELPLLKMIGIKICVAIQSTNN